MCGRFVRKKTVDEIAQEFGVRVPSFDLPASYNVAPTQPVLILTQEEEKALAVARWGLIPSWAKDPSIGNKLINARAETLLEKPSFRTPFRKRRCLVIADGFYEWKLTDTGKQPMYIRLKSQQTFAFAGLYDRWESPEGDQLTTCTIITTTPNELMEKIHNRMPAILPKDVEDLWLDRTVKDYTYLVDILAPYPAAEMQAYAVSKGVNSPSQNSPACIAPV